MPRDAWIDIFSFATRHELEACQLVWRKFEGIISSNLKSLPQRRRLHLEVAEHFVRALIAEGDEIRVQHDGILTGTAAALRQLEHDIRVRFQE